ncbi:MAG: glycoside hydrolase family 5 protein, partial [Oscillospiraceae bacterium]
KPQNYETAWNNPVTTKELITAVKNAGFNAVRVPVTWSDHIDENGSINKEWLDRVQQVVDHVISQDLYCVLNVHHDGGADGWLEASSNCYKKNSKKFAGLWNNIAIRFREYGDRLLFESFNEMLDSRNSWSDAQESDAYKAVNDFNQLFVDTVRATGGNNAERNLMVQVYSGSCSEKALAGFVLPKDITEGHLIIQTHNYDPQGFTSSDATWTTMTDTWGSDAEKSYFDQLFKRLENFSKEQGAPLVIGEFGANYKGNESSRELYAGYFVKTAAEHGIKCFWWDTGDMALFDRSTATIKYPGMVKALTTNASSTHKPLLWEVDSNWQRITLNSSLIMNILSWIIA